MAGNRLPPKRERLSSLVRRKKAEYAFSHPNSRNKIMAIEIYSHLLERKITNPIVLQKAKEQLPQFVRVLVLKEHSEKGVPCKKKLVLDSLDNAILILDQLETPQYRKDAQRSRGIFQELRKIYAEIDNDILVPQILAYTIFGTSFARMIEIMGERKFALIDRAARWALHKSN